MNRGTLFAGSLLGGMFIGVQYKDHILLAKNNAFLKVRRAVGLPAPPKRDISSVLGRSREIIKDMRTAVLATTHTDEKSGQVEPDARVIYTTAADGDMVVVFNTTKHSRKAKELRENPRCSLTYLHRPSQAYVTLKGEAHALPTVEAQQFWDDSLSEHYANDRAAFSAWRFEPEALEVVDLTHGLDSTRKDWKPITLRRGSKDLPWIIESTGHDEVVISQDQVLIR